MSLEIITLNGYGQFVWPAFIFTFLCFFILYLKLNSEFKKQEKIFLIEYKKNFVSKIQIARPKKNSKEILSGNTIY